MSTGLKLKRREKSKQRKVQIKKSIRAKEKNTVCFYANQEQSAAEVFVDNRDVEPKILDDPGGIGGANMCTMQQWSDEPQWGYSSDEDHGMAQDFAGCGRDCGWCGRCMY